MTRIGLALGLLALLAPFGALAGSHASVGHASAGEVSIFYYPWYGTPRRDGGYLHWAQGGHVPPLDLATTDYPARGPYSGSDPAVVDAQMWEIAGAGIREVVSSWWGWGSLEDQRLPLILRLARRHGLEVAVQIEPYPGRSAWSVAVDIAHLLGLGITRFYVYRPFDTIDEAEWTVLLAPLHGVQVLGQTASVARARAAHFTGVYTYDIVTYGPAAFDRLCAAAHAAGLLCDPSVGPGYDALRATGDTHVLPRRDGATYDAMWQAAIHAGADRITITSFNEWHEGTQIEPALTLPVRRLAVAAGPTISPVVQPYLSYEGAYGLHGWAASLAYLARTAYWTDRFREVFSSPGGGRT
jgi:glycoprotein endo-alpha-1,2-mannosidase